MRNLLNLLIPSLLVINCYSMRGSAGGGQTEFEAPREINPEDIIVPEGFTIEPVARNLTFPTGIAIDDSGRLYVTEAGYSYGEEWTTPRLLEIISEDSFRTIVKGEKNGPWNGVTLSNGNFFIAEGGQLQGGRILKVSRDGQVDTLVKDLPSLGDHHTNGPAAGKDGFIYFGQGTATNSGVVGTDNADFGWLQRNPDFHDIPCTGIKLRNNRYKTPNPLTEDQNDEAETGPYAPFDSSAEGDSVPGAIPCSGAILRVSENGGNPELVAWGFRNPFGLAFSPDSQLFITENGFDDRGSRPVWGTGDFLWKVESGRWYGWPDFAGGDSVFTQMFAPPGRDPPRQVLARFPDSVPRPSALLGVHSSSNSFDFSSSKDFGYFGQAFIAQFGDMSPNVGKVLTPVGFKVIRVDVDSGTVYDFAVNKQGTGPASKLNSGGLERPAAARFSPDGKSLYIVDFGVMTIDEDGSHPRKNTGVVWKVSRKGDR